MATPRTLPLVSFELYPRRSCLQHENHPENTPSPAKVGIVYKLTSWFSFQDQIDWCCFYFSVKNGLVAVLETLYTWISFLDSWNRFFFINFFFQFLCVCVCVCVCEVSSKVFFLFSRPSHPGPCARLSLFLLCADFTCVLVCMCLCMCMWKMCR